MIRLVVASTRKNAGKTSLIVGLAKNTQQSFAYFKPFGDRLLYKKKRLWDYDSALMTNIFSLTDPPEELSIGFDHSKLMYMYDESSMAEKIKSVANTLEANRQILFIESGETLAFGISVHMDAFTIAKNLDARMVIVLSGKEEEIYDDLIFLAKRVDWDNISVAGVILNKIEDVENFRDYHLPKLQEYQIPILGVIPFRAELTQVSVGFVAQKLLAKVLTGDEFLNRPVGNFLIGAMSVTEAMKSPVFQTPHKVIITGGDRSDMILAALESDCSAIILTNNILPPANIISLAAKNQVPLLLSPHDTFKTAKIIDDMEPLMSHDETDKISLVADLVRQHVNIDALLKE